MKFCELQGCVALLGFCCALGASGAAEAADAVDDAGASPAYDEWIAGDNGGTGFGPWEFSDAPASATFTRAAVSAATVGGDASAMDAGGRCFVQTNTYAIFGLAEAAATRPIAIPLADGAEISFVAQRFGVSGVNTESEIHVLDAAGNFKLAILAGVEGWRYNGQGILEATGIAASTPVHITITDHASAGKFDIEFEQLDGPANVAAKDIACFGGSSGHAATLRFVTRQVDAGQSRLLFNKLSVVVPETPSPAADLFVLR